MKKPSKNILNYTLVIMVILLVGMILLFPKLPEAEQARNNLEKHLKMTYNEEFVVTLFGQGRGSNYEGEVYPKRYVGTVREYDSYYRGRGIVPETTLIARDEYQMIIFKESINEYFKPKLEELFNENVLPVFERTYYKDKNDGVTYEKLLESGYRVELSGYIYVFGSINNEDDIKKYQKGIFEFVQYLKKSKNFNNTKIGFIIVDERVLEDDFYDLDIKNQLLEAQENSKTDKDFYVKRERIMSQIKYTNVNKTERIYEINRGKLDSGVPKYYGDYALGVLYVISKKMMESEYNYSERIFKTEVGKDYDKIEDITIEGLVKNLKERINAKDIR